MLKFKKKSIIFLSLNIFSASWTTWTPWSDCDITCGSGQNVRSRECTGQGECLGNLTDTKICIKEECRKFLFCSWGWNIYFK